jgi:RecA-family ATPase
MTVAAATARRVRTPRQHIIQGVMPANHCHLLAGPSGAGKTTLLFQQIDAIAKGGEFLGHRCITVPQAYVSCDRSLDSVYDTLDRMNIDIDIPMWSTIDSDINENFAAILNFVRSKVPDVKLLHIDGFTSLCPKGNITDYYIVQGFLKSISRLCKGGLTVQGLCHDAKLRQGHEYIMERERVIGSSAWGGFSETIIHIAPANPKDAADTRRAITILPRNAANETMTYAIMDGRLLPSDLGGDVVDLFMLEADIQRHPSDMLRAADIVAYGATHSISRATSYRYIEKLIDGAKLERVEVGGRERGMYKRVRPS